MQRLAGGESNLQPGWVNDTFPLPSGGGGTFNPEAGGGYYSDQGDLPPAANVGPTPPSTAPDLTPSQGGPGSYPAGGAPPLDIPLVPPAQYDFYGNQDNPTMSDADMIARLGFDPGDPRNDLTTGFGSGRPTQKGVGTVTSIAGNAVFPGLGLATGPLGSWLTRMFQNWAGQRNVNNALNPKGGGGGGDSSGGGGGSFDRWSASGIPGVGVGINPSGAPAVGREWWSPDFGRENLGSSGLGAGGYYNSQGPGGPIGTAGIVNTSSPAGGGSFFGGRGNLGMSLPGSFAGLGSFSGADPLSGAWGGINSPVARFALGGGQFDPARTPAPGFQWSPAQLRLMGGPATYPGGAPIINPAAFGASTSPGSSAHFNPKANQ